MQPKRLVLLCRDAALDKKAEDPVVLEVARLTNLSHYFLITHGNSDRHVRAIADNILEQLEKHKVRAWHVEGLETGHWVLIDFSSVIVHIFYRETREFYSLERLWGEAPRL